MKKPESTSTTAPTLPLKISARHHEIVNFLGLLGHGEFLDALADDRLKCEKAVLEVGKAAELTIKIKLMPNGHNKRILRYDIKPKIPTVPSMDTYAFATEQGQYVESDPDQRELPLKNVTSIEEAAKIFRAVGE